MHFKKPHWPRSLRARLLVVYALGMVLSAVLVGTIVMLSIDTFGRYTLRFSAARFAHDISDNIQFNAQGRPVGFEGVRLENWLLTAFGDAVAVRILDAAGQVVFSPSGHTDALAPAGQVFDPAVKVFTLQLGGVSAHGSTAPVVHAGQTWYVQFASSDRLVLQLRQVFGVPALHAGMLFIGLTFLAIFLVATHITLQRMLKPLRTAAEAAQRITPRTLNARLEARDLPQELAPLVDAFNHALDRLQTGFRTQQEFLANAAHELKTPLALIRAQIELEPHAAHTPDLLQDVDRMGRQVLQLLHLAEASEPRNYHLDTLAPSTALAEVCAYMDRVARRADVRIAQQIDMAAGDWTADRGALFTLFKNLLENAIQHSPPGSVVTVRAHTQGFSVWDQGSGVPPTQLDRLFERFWRAPERRDIGAGLGLSICQEIARAHGWLIEARNMPPGGQTGLCVEVRFES